MHIVHELAVARTQAVSMLLKDELLECSHSSASFHVHGSRPMESLQIDYCGPFPADEEGDTQVLTVIDTFTQAIGLKDLEVKHTARCLIRQIGIFGCPSPIVTDRGGSNSLVILLRR